MPAVALQIVKSGRANCSVLAVCCRSAGNTVRQRPCANKERTHASGGHCGVRPMERSRGSPSCWQSPPAADRPGKMCHEMLQLPSIPAPILLGDRQCVQIVAPYARVLVMPSFWRIGACSLRVNRLQANNRARDLIRTGASHRQRRTSPLVAVFASYGWASWRLPTRFCRCLRKFSLSGSRRSASTMVLSASSR